MGETTPKENIVLCVLSPLNLNEDNEDADCLPEEKDYSEPNGEKYTGIQTNEAPVKYLIERAHEHDNDIDEVTYFCSKECRTADIPTSAVRHLKGFSDITGDYLSTEDFFIKRITAFCQEAKIKVPIFNPIEDYAPSLPADSLYALSEHLNNRYTAHIDLTGGPRDAAVLLTLAIQLLKKKSPDNEIGCVVYANFKDESITKQNTTIDLIDLFNAVDSFLRYGRADQLCSFFKDNQNVTEETKLLCAAARDFSDALALCQLDNIDAKVKAVQDAMRNAEGALGDKIECYQNISDQLNCVSSAQEKTKLEAAKAKTMIIRSELLLHSLIPAMRDRFISPTKDTSELTLSIIQWCAEHQMIQQALCIYREKISECLLAMGFFETKPHYEELSPYMQKKLVVDICKQCKITGDAYPDNSLTLTKDEKGHEYFALNKDKLSQLHYILAWYFYLHPIRNIIMHSDGNRGGRNYNTACKLLNKNPQARLSLKELKTDIIKAVLCITTPHEFKPQTWKQAIQATRKKKNKKRKTAAK